jgi:hypothetical protein
MKKRILILMVVLLVAALAVVPVLAKQSVVKGVVAAVDGDRITLETKKGGTVVVIAPEDFDTAALAVGDWVLAKGRMQGDELLAEWVRKVGGKSSENEEKSEGKKDNSAYCNPDKKQDAHPMAAALAEKYGADPAWVMDNFCGGYSMGAIMLALKTQTITGADPDEMLELRSEGQGWGAIWKELKMIGNERDAKTPPGLLKKP